MSGVWWGLGAGGQLARVANSPVGYVNIRNKLARELRLQSIYK